MSAEESEKQSPVSIEELRISHADKYNAKKKLLIAHAKKKQQQKKNKATIIKSKSKKSNDKQVVYLQKRVQQLENQLSQEKQKSQSKINKLSTQLHSIKQTNYKLRQEQRNLDKEKKIFFENQTKIEQTNSKHFMELTTAFNYLDNLGFNFNEPQQFDKLKQQYKEQLIWFVVYMLIYEKKYKQLRQEAHSVRKNLNNWSHQVYNFRKETTNYKNTIKQYKQQLQVKNALIKKLKDEKRSLEEQLDRIKYSKSLVPSMIDNLIEQVNTNNINAYQNLETLEEKIHKVFEDETSAKKQYSVHNNDNLFVYGYVQNSKDGKHHYLTNTTNNLTIEFLATPQQELQLKNGCAVAIKEYKDKKYHLVRFYEVVDWLNKQLREKGSVKVAEINKEEINKPVKINSLLHTHKEHKVKTSTLKIKNKPLKEQHKEEIVKLTNQAELDWASQQSILVIGNKNVKDFTNQLSKYSKTEQIDAYEKSLQQIFIKMRTHSLIFVLKGSVPHSVTNFIKNNSVIQNKVHYFYVPKQYDGIARLHLIYSNL